MCASLLRFITVLLLVAVRLEKQKKIRVNVLCVCVFCNRFYFIILYKILSALKYSTNKTKSGIVHKHSLTHTFNVYRWSMQFRHFSFKISEFFFGNYNTNVSSPPFIATIFSFVSFWFILYMIFSSSKLSIMLPNRKNNTLSLAQLYNTLKLVWKALV